MVSIGSWKGAGTLSPAGFSKGLTKGLTKTCTKFLSAALDQSFGEAVPSSVNTRTAQEVLGVVEGGSHGMWGQG